MRINDLITVFFVVKNFVIKGFKNLANCQIIVGSINLDLV